MKLFGVIVDIYSNTEVEVKMNAATTPETTIESIPDDLAHCHAVIGELTATIRLQEREKAALLHRIEQLLRQVYGRRSEKIDPAQLLLFVAEAMAAVVDAGAQSEVEAPPATPKKKGHGRKKPPAELPHLPLEYPVPEADKVCPFKIGFCNLSRLSFEKALDNTGLGVK